MRGNRLDDVPADLRHLTQLKGHNPGLGLRAHWPFRSNEDKTALASLSRLVRELDDYWGCRQLLVLQSRDQGSLLDLLPTHLAPIISQYLRDLFWEVQPQPSNRLIGGHWTQ